MKHGEQRGRKERKKVGRLKEAGGGTKGRMGPGQGMKGGGDNEGRKFKSKEGFSRKKK